MFPGSTNPSSYVATSSFARGSGGGVSRADARPASAIPRQRVGAYEIELRGALDLDGIAEPWSALARRALEPNPFCEHALLAAAARHLPEGRRLVAVTVWRGERLVGLAPATSGRTGFGPRRLAPWRVDLLPSAAPLLDRDEAGAVLDTLVAFARGRDAALGLADAPAESALGALLAERGFAPVPAPAGDASRPVSGAAGEGSADVGAPRLAVTSARGIREIRDAVELFLALDAEAAAAGRFPALVQDPGRANLVRTATRRAGREKTCRVAIARRGDAVVAAAVLMRGALWIGAEAPGAPGTLATLLARASATRSQPARLDWTSAPVGSPRRRPERPGGLVATARRLFSPLTRLRDASLRGLTPPGAGAA